MRVANRCNLLLGISSSANSQRNNNRGRGEIRAKGRSRDRAIPWYEIEASRGRIYNPRCPKRVRKLRGIRRRSRARDLFSGTTRKSRKPTGHENVFRLVLTRLSPRKIEFVSGSVAACMPTNVPVLVIRPYAVTGDHCRRGG